MEKTTIHYIKEAVSKLENCQLQGPNFVEATELLQKIKEDLNLENTDEAAVFSIVFSRNMAEGAYTDMSDIAQHIGCSEADILEYVSAITRLSKSGYLKSFGRRMTNIVRQNFGIDDAVSSAIIENRKIDLRVESNNSQVSKYDFCSTIGEAVEDTSVSASKLVYLTSKMEEESEHLAFIQNLKNLVPDVEDRILYYDICYDAFKNQDKIENSYTDISRTVTDIYSDFCKIVNVRRSLSEESHNLMKAGLIERKDEDSIRLTYAGMDLFFEEDLSVFRRSCKCKDIYEFVEKLSSAFHGDEFDSGSGLGVLTRKLNEIEQSNTHIPVIADIRNAISEAPDRVLFYIVASDTVSDSSTSLTSEVKQIYPISKRKAVCDAYKDNKALLQTRGLAKIEKSSSLFGERTFIELTDKGKELVFGEDASLFIVDETSKDLLQPEKIAEKRLFYSDELESQLSLVRNSLMEESYIELCSRLEEAHLPKGMNILFYGEPGTGKTETVLQLAKATGRPILHVDISATKTCWFGESEKLIKKVFTNYKALCEKSELKPILLFNEADAVFSKRKDINSSNVAQTENAIQNIILEEMENMEGIMIATTNLADNLDGAFERRFLFKVHFDRPTIEAKKSIWQNKMSVLTDEEAEKLASQFDLSGGQIDNIVRKSFMQQIIAGEKPTLASLTKLCNEERILSKNNSKVGFGK